MKKVLIKKLWQGHLISIRDYVVEQGIRDGGIEVSHNGETMALSVDALNRGRKLTRDLKSKFPNSRSYGLIDYEWNPCDARQTKMEIK
tara:strand:- start:332 stop:595 length:264 start_codon:yes stop_codon:yes gene_type:complete